MNLIPISYKRHIFVCVNERQGDCCAGKGSMEILMLLRDYINKNGLVSKYNVTKTKCLGHCEDGPTIAIYPDGNIYTHVTKEDVNEIIEKFLS